MNELIAQNFFFIDSDSLNDLKTRLYGYYLENDIVTQDTFTSNMEVHPDIATGAYIHLKVENDDIVITQSFGGGYGLFYFKSGNYFAISNSFMLMLDRLKYRFPLTFNTAAADSFIVEDLTSMSYQETMVNEITLLQKNIRIHINKRTKTLAFEKIDYKENTTPINSEEGIHIVDQWYDKWTNFIYKLDKISNQISVDLSGGQDSRATLMLFLGSGIDMSHIRVNSSNDSLHTHSEDYQIATAIGNHFGFSLNRMLPANTAKRLSLEDTVNISYYTKLGFHKQLYYKEYITENPRFTFTGAAGECLKSTPWDIPTSKFAEKKLELAERYKSVNFKKSVEQTLDEDFRGIARDYNIKDLDSRKIMWQWYADIRTRYHYSMADVGAYLVNNIRISPLFDPLPRRISSLTEDNTDRNLLYVLMHLRFCPELLDFPYQGGRKWAPQTIEYAKKLNAAFPRKQNKDAKQLHSSIINTGIGNTARILVDKIGLNKNVSPNTFFKRIVSNYPMSTSSIGGVDQANRFTRDLFSSKTFKDLFLKYYPVEVYEKAEKYSKEHAYYPLQQMYPIIAIVKVLHDIEISRAAHSDSIYREMNNFIFSPSTREDTAYKGRLLKQTMDFFETARIDLKNSGTAQNSLQVVLSDTNGLDSCPAWYTNQSGVGHMVTSSAGSITLNLLCQGDGTLDIFLRGLDKRRLNDYKQRLPLWIDYTTFVINGKAVFDSTMPVWHDKPFHYSQKVEDGEKLTITLKWQPHGYTNEAFNDLFYELLGTLN